MFSRRLSSLTPRQPKCATTLLGLFALSRIRLWRAPSSPGLTSIGVAPHLRADLAAILAPLLQLAAEGLLSKTLIIAMGEFGRTPEISGQGRGHHPKCFSVMLAGGGVQGGQSVGASNKTGHEPLNDGYSVPDLFHTVCAACGIDGAKFRDSNAGRPIRIADRGSKQIPGIFG